MHLTPPLPFHPNRLPCPRPCPFEALLLQPNKITPQHYNYASGEKGLVRSNSLCPHTLGARQQAVSFDDKIYVFGGLRLRDPDADPPGEILNSLVSLRRLALAHSWCSAWERLALSAAWMRMHGQRLVCLPQAWNEACMTQPAPFCVMCPGWGGAISVQLTDPSVAAASKPD